MKVFQIIDGKCHWDATSQFPTVQSTVGYFPTSDLFVAAPDYVWEGWGYVDGEFIEPTPPGGLLYDRETNTFYDPNPDAAMPYTETQELGQQLTDEELARIEMGQHITDLELMILGGMTNV